jgi:energy-converting hydrogenase Eha subunit C
MRTPTVIQEQDGAWSMRRTLALLYALSSNVCLWVAALSGQIAGVYAGLAAMAAVLILLGYTTVEGIRRLAGELKGSPCGTKD